MEYMGRKITVIVVVVIGLGCHQINIDRTGIPCS